MKSYFSLVREELIESLLNGFAEVDRHVLFPLIEFVGEFAICLVSRFGDNYVLLNLSGCRVLGESLIGGHVVTSFGDLCVG